MTKKKPRRRGLAPAPARLAEMHEDGYGTPSEVAAAAGVSGSSVYTWVASGGLKPLGGKPASKKVGANVWVLFGAVAIRAGLKACTQCGCTDTRACPGGCSWASETVCSRCIKKKAA